MNIFTKIILIPAVMAYSHGAVHSHSHSHSTYSIHKSYNPHHVSTSVIAKYLIFGHFSHAVENFFYINENYYTYNITYYLKLLDDDYKECIYYVVSNNFNYESTIDASNMRIVENVSFVQDYDNNLREFCRTLNDEEIEQSMYGFGKFISVILVLIVLCCCITYLCGDDNYSSRALY